jgi:hypothetical protein
MANLNLSDHPWIVLLSLAPLLLLVLRRCGKMGLNPVLPLAGLVGGIVLELKRSGGSLPNGLPLLDGG